jgi:hypothetical protein
LQVLGPNRRKLPSVGGGGVATNAAATTSLTDGNLQEFEPNRCELPSVGAGGADGRAGGPGRRHRRSPAPSRGVTRRASVEPGALGWPQ